ncbi:hypothetical protein Slin15195_G081020 [Septoria linicola]|uniref:Uncharacterized protein n=1 Tax=Septoria linicola TaxID=215465 RepID=A0A9Q9EMT1_9PEZI|nr:hypothetical protein Slin14017_G042230 [Septoria linicola]USW54783.1 hypothetical protein Slin15195_G081020 [Septoria linicola]
MGWPESGPDPLIIRRFFLCRRSKNAASDTISSAPIATPTPKPAVAPVLSGVELFWLCGVGKGMAVEVTAESVDCDDEALLNVVVAGSMVVENDSRAKYAASPALKTSEGSLQQEKSFVAKV